MADAGVLSAGDLSVELVCQRYWSYVYASTRRSLIRSISVAIVTRQPGTVHSVYPRVRCESPFDEPIASEWVGLPRQIHGDGAAFGTSVEWSDVQPRINYALLGRLEERAPINVVVDVVDAETEAVIATETHEVLLLGRQDWFWDSTQRADMLAAFVNPRSPAVRSIVGRARELLNERTGESSTEGYQSGPERVSEIARAVYDATSERGIDYSNPPAGFDNSMQRIRTPDEVVADQAGTCLDTSILIASCLAEAGLEPVLFLVPGHAFAGFFTGREVALPHGRVSEDQAASWLADHSPSPVLRGAENADWLGEILHGRHVQPVETTTVCRGIRAGFSQAITSQNNWQPGDIGAIEGMVIVSQCWKAGISPPIRLAAESLAEPSDASEFEKRVFGPATEESPASAVENPPSSAFRREVAELNVDERSTPPRVRQWMASLLDLSARNPLLRIKKGTLKFDVPASGLGQLDDLLFTPKGRITIQSPADLPAQWMDNGVTPDEFEAWNEPASRLVYPSYRRLNEFASHVDAQVRRWQQDPAIQGVSDVELVLQARNAIEEEFRAPLKKSLLAAQRKAKDALLSTGTNCLYLALGAITWTDESEGGGQGKSRQWEAPLYLYPVTLEGGRRAPYTLRLDTSGEATPNHCLREKLRREPYNLDLPELLNPQEDESGLDFDKMFESIQARLAEAKLHNFAVVPNAYLGVFDYSTFRLWSDFQDGWQVMVDKSDAARHLILTPNQEFTEPEESSDAALEAYLPIDADDSQETAIRWALDGRSFRLEGPPGTGKTQTITNLIASCLAHGKKILFVAEKQAALDQVKKRLSSVGLADYCLDLHAQGDSDTRIRKNIQASLTAALAANADARDGEWADISYRLQREVEVLDRYREALHSMGSAELSAWGARENLLEIADVEPIQIPPNLLNDHEALWPRVRQLAFDLTEHAQQAGTAATNPWSIVQAGGPAELDDDAVTEALRRLGKAHAEATRLAGIPNRVIDCDDPRAWRLLADLAEIVTRHGDVIGLVRSGSATASSWQRSAADLISRTTTVRENLSDNPLPLSLLLSEQFEQLHALRDEVSTAGIFTRRKKTQAFRALLDPPEKLSDVEILCEFDALLAVQPEVDELNALSSETLGLPEELQRELLTGSLDLAVASIETVQSLSTAASEISGGGDFVASALGSEMNAITREVAITLASAWRSVLELVPFDPGRLSSRRAGQSMSEFVPEIVDELSQSASASGRFLDLHRWRRLMDTHEQLHALGFDGLLPDLVDGFFEHEIFLARVQVGVFREVLKERLESGDLDRFDRKTHDNRINAFERALNEARSLLHERIPGLINKRSTRRVLPSGRAVGEAQDLLRNLKPKRGQKTPIRDLIAKYGDSLADAMPCFMMSPDSVASLVPVDAVDFDLVIFDEASQVRTSHAVGALGRGRAGIVVGDSKQMPPTVGFSANDGTYIEDEPTGSSGSGGEKASEVFGEAARDAESILSEFDESGFPALQLLCHYRSRDELLIAFSNTHVYDEPMLTFPSTSGMKSSALRLIVVDGEFIRDANAERWRGQRSREAVPSLRTNPAEAEAVVAECVGRLRDPARIERRATSPGTSAESIIVVTFNIQQMNLITAMFRDADPDLYEQATSEWVDEETGVKHEPQLKIRNLENVQGDEAETVVFSVAFSATKAGKFPLNFGPVTQHSGIRRLNVAVTRAQREMIVFASFRPDDMGDLSNKAEGARMLQKFLRLAEKGAESTGQLGVAVDRSRHLARIAEAIRDRGFDAEVQMGFSEMRVDIAVKRPDATEWQVAILADGPSWAERGSAYQREVLPVRVLEGLGWRRVTRIWLPAWLEESDAILADLQSLLDNLDDLPTEPDLGTEHVSLANPAAPAAPLTDAAPESPEADVQTSFAAYEVEDFGDEGVLDAAFLSADAAESVRACVDAVLGVEGPVEIGRLATLVANSFGFARVAASRREQVISLINAAQIHTDANGTFVTTAANPLPTYADFRVDAQNASRNPNEISTTEYVNAFVWILEATRSLDAEDAVRELGAVFGFRTISGRRRESLVAAIDSAVEGGRVLTDADRRYRLA